MYTHKYILTHICSLIMKIPCAIDVLCHGPEYIYNYTYINGTTTVFFFKKNILLEKNSNNVRGCNWCWLESTLSLNSKWFILYLSNQITLFPTVNGKMCLMNIQCVWKTKKKLFQKCVLYFGQMFCSIDVWKTRMCTSKNTEWH